MEFNNAEKMERMVKGACKPVTPSSEFRDGLRQRLIIESDSASRGDHSMLSQVKLGLIAAAGVVSGIIGYGVWLSLKISA